jgi:transitional endoplasmic reticulum ATPase
MNPLLEQEYLNKINKSKEKAKKHYDSGAYDKASEEYLNCSKYCEILVKKTEDETKKKEYYEAFEKFTEAASKLKRMKVAGVTVEGGNKRGLETTEEPEEEKAKSFILVEKPDIRFKDIAGLEGVKEQIKEAIVYPFKYPEEYKYFGVKGGGGILLYGPPGCGKTMLAAAAAGECDVVFINLKISDIKDKYVGESEKKIKEVFKLARSYEKAIISFDEIDALAGERSELKTGHERSLVNELLSQMDGLESKGSEKCYLVLVATNMPWDVDIALRRAGRFDTTIFIPHPDFEARKRILEIGLKDKPCSVEIEKLAVMTEGFASAEIIDICVNAARIPLRERIKEEKPRREITMVDFEKVLKARKTVLSSWYSKAVKAVANSEEAEMFGELVEAGRVYLER